MQPCDLYASCLCAAAAGADAESGDGCLACSPESVMYEHLECVRCRAGRQWSERDVGVFGAGGGRLELSARSALEPAAAGPGDLWMCSAFRGGGGSSSRGGRLDDAYFHFNATPHKHFHVVT